jgi:hypothetical protein
MTNETTVTTETPVDAHKNNAVQFVNSRSMADIIDHLSDQYKMLEASKENNKAIRTRLQELVNVVERFVKDNYEDGASQSDLKELAEQLDIELTKNLTVTFTVNCEFDLTVPLDFNEEDINDGMFDVSIEPRFRNEDIDVDSESIEVEDFDVSE